MSARKPALLEPTASRLWDPSFAGSAHLVGICGAGMKALAEALRDVGWTISGCDRDPHPPAQRGLEAAGISIATEHHRDHVHSQQQLLISSPAVSSDHPERQRAAELEIPQLSYIDALAALTRTMPTWAIAGTHGKSSTTAMLGTILRSANRKPTVICGAESRQLQRSGWADTGRLAVVEACEFRRHFHQLQPQSACLLGIEPDHFDCYPTLSDAIDAYRKFVETIPQNGVLVYRSDCAATREVVASARARCVSFSLADPAAQWQVKDVLPDSGGMQFRLLRGEEISARVRVDVPGRHNVQNALAAAACASACGLSLAEIVAGLESFCGLQRRLERMRDFRQAAVFDDYAHHPTEVRAAIEAVRQSNPGRRIVCVFQPHQLSRTSRLLDEFGAALDLADRTYVLPVYAAREAENAACETLSQALLERFSSGGCLIPSLDRVWSTIETDAGADAVILTLGAGTLSRIHHDRT
jgi:UDP-N-acetylmuramate--alanine ligase